MRPSIVFSLILHAGAAGALWFHVVDVRTPQTNNTVVSVFWETPAAPEPPPQRPPMPAAPTAEEPLLRVAADEPVDDMEWPLVEHPRATAPLMLLAPHKLGKPLRPKKAPPPPARPTPRPVRMVRAVRAAAPAPVIAPTAPRVDRAKPTPVRYPSRARRAGHEGRVVVLAHVAATGSAARVEVVASSGHTALDRAALAAVKGWTFIPATRDGKPVAGRLRVPVDFVLRDT